MGTPGPLRGPLLPSAHALHTAFAWGHKTYLFEGMRRVATMLLCMSVHDCACSAGSWDNDVRRLIKNAIINRMSYILIGFSIISLFGKRKEGRNLFH